MGTMDFMGFGKGTLALAPHWGRRAGTVRAHEIKLDDPAQGPRLRAACLADGAGIAPCQARPGTLGLCSGPHTRATRADLILGAL